jgi:ribosomal protein S18 acetylase RimI-like enzyme
MRGVGRWALENGARNVALAVTRANVAANELYEALGMNVVGSYHYRIK